MEEGGVIVLSVVIASLLRGFPGRGADLWKLGGQFSPDGRTVAYVSDKTGRNEVYLRSVVRSAEAAANRNGRLTERSFSIAMATHSWP
jgi:hypothetical protein